MGLTAEEYMREYADQRRVWLAEKAGAPVDDDEDEPVVGGVTTVTTPNHKIGFEKLGISPKKAFNAAVALGLEVQAWLTVGDVSPVLYMADSKEGNKTSYSAGDVRYEGYVARRYTVEARHPEHALGFRASYMGKGAEGSTAAFQAARVADPVGIVRPNAVDYTVDKNRAKELNWSEERRIQEGMAMNRRVNDGTTRLVHDHTFQSGGEFSLWIDEWLTLLAPDAKRMTPKKKAPAADAPPEPATDAVLLGGQEWAA
jgi:hypothetical protein